MTANGAAVDAWLANPAAGGSQPIERLLLSSPDPDDLTLRQARLLAQADRVVHAADVPSVLLDRARADAVRIVSSTPPLDAGDGLTLYLEMAR
jgi:uroporphyrin-III C-methyltransferase/precorrin-2 dehydrogenase/sirohydrochlorin ferrochelatase